jgi:hypothetical protein
MPLIDAQRIEPIVLDMLRRLTIPATLRDAVIAFARQRLEEPATTQEATIAALRAQLERIRDTYQLGDLSREEYLRRREQLQRRLAQATPPPSRVLDIERATNMLSDPPALIDAATREQQRAFIRLVVTKIWIEKLAVTAIQPAANFLLLVEAIAGGFNGDLDWARTSNLQLRRLTLYPIELRGRAVM